MLILKLTKKNMMRLANLKKDERLIFNAQGLLECSPSFWSRFRQQRTKRAIVLIFTVFCHEAKHPTQLDYFDPIVFRTLKVAREALERLRFHPLYASIATYCEEIVSSYKRHAYMQSRILRFMYSSIERDEHHELLQDALKGLEIGKEPLPAKMGASGVYLMPGARRGIAGVFKPFDEEIGGPNNPQRREFRGPFGVRHGGFGVIVGTGVWREIAAYLVSKKLSLGIVPQTCFAAFRHYIFHDTFEGHCIKEKKWKFGSFQEYWAGYHHFFEFPLTTLEGILFDQLHRVMILDMIIGNMDRNLGNLLTNGRSCIAIDHALSFGTLPKITLLEGVRHLPQFHIPIQGVLKERVLGLKSNAVKATLKRRCLIEDEALELMEERIHKLQEGVRDRILPVEMIAKD